MLPYIIAAIVVIFLIISGVVVMRKPPKPGAATPFEEYDFSADELSRAQSEEVHDYAKPNVSVEDQVAYVHFNEFYMPFEAKNYLEAQKHVKSLLVYNNINEDMYFDLGTLYQELKDFKLSAKYYQEAIKMNPIFAEAQSKLAYICLQNEAYEAALAATNKAIDLDFMNAFVYNNKGRAKMLLGDLEVGLEWIEKAEQMAPANPYSIFCFGIYALLKGDPIKALEQFVQAKKMDVKQTILEMDVYIHKAKEGLKKL